VDFDTLILSCEKPAHNLGRWIETLVGPIESPLQEISGGAWRAIAYGNDERSWPAVAAHQERRKFLARSGGADYLIKFAGLGPIGERLAERAAALSDAGFIPPTADFVHGFLVQRWREDLRPLDLARVDRAALIAHLARYLAFRAWRFPAAIESGASGEALLAMVVRNVGLDLGEPAGEAAARRVTGLPELDAGLRRIETDNRLQAHEWLVDPAGRLWKADAVDHHAAHDLIGCQDLAWDITGARIELDLSEGEVGALCAAIEAEGASVDRARLAMLPVPYLAFHLGRARMAADALAGWPAEAARLAREAERYRVGLQALLA
jgi:hypothetical protein